MQEATNAAEAAINYAFVGSPNMQTNAQKELETLEARCKELRAEIQRDKIAPVILCVQESLILLRQCADGPSLYDTRTGANHWSHRDNIERTLEEALDELQEWQGRQTR